MGRARRALAVIGAIATLTPFATPSAGAQPATCAIRDPLPPGLDSALANAYPGRRFTAAVLDGSGCMYGMNPAHRITTASVVKLEILAGILLRAQNEGRETTQWERDRLWPMITESANTAASELWQSLGGVPGMEAIDDAFGLTETDHVGPTWGLTSTSAADQVRLMSEVVPGLGGPLAAHYRDEARLYLTNVVPEQRWGASAGVPGGWAVAQKNGFAAAPCCGWRINTVGWIERPDGSGWAVALLTDGWATEESGTAVNHDVTGSINRAATDPWFGGVGAATTSATRRDVFVRSPSGVLRQEVWTPSGYAGWFHVGGVATSDPEAATPGAGVIPQVFVTGTDSALWATYWNGSRWVFYGLGGVCTSGPAAVFSGTGRLDVSCRGSDGRLWARTWTNTGNWTGWYLLGGNATSDPDAASPSAGSAPRYFVRGTDNDVWMYYLASGRWSLAGLGGICTSGPTAAYSGPNRLDVFCRGTDGQLWTRTWTNTGNWTGWSAMGGLAGSDPEAVAISSGTAPRVFARGTDTSVWEWAHSSSRWTYVNWGRP